MVMSKKPLAKNKRLRDVKKTSDVKTYKTLAKAVNLKKSSPEALKKIVFEQKILANSLILEARIAEKTKMLSKEERANASHFIKLIYNEVLIDSRMHDPKYFKFTKELAKAINRLEGKEVLSILKVASEKIKYIN